MGSRAAILPASAIDAPPNLKTRIKQPLKGGKDKKEYSLNGYKFTIWKINEHLPGSRD
jgi:hypothetical protein